MNGHGLAFGAIMQLTLRDNLPFTQITIAYQSAAIVLRNVLIDTGSATTILSADAVAAVQIVPSPQDVLYTIRGVGGSEVVFDFCLGWGW